MNRVLRDELLARVAEDQRVRAELVADGSLFDGYHPRMAAVHAENAAVLDALVAANGWPGRSLVDDEGCEAAWTILQHAIAHPDLQRTCLPLLESAAAIGEIPACQVAFLHDRICCFEGRPQRYGTQFDWDPDGNLSPLPLEDAERVDEFRNSVGLAPLAVRIEQARQEAAQEGAGPPADYDKRQAEKAAWARSVGWL